MTLFPKNSLQAEAIRDNLCKQNVFDAPSADFPFSFVLKMLCMSPTVFREKGYRFFFFSREEERMHIHVVSGDGEAKFWIEPEIELATNYHYSSRQPKQIRTLVEVHYDELISAWNEHFKN